MFSYGTSGPHVPPPPFPWGLQLGSTMGRYNKSLDRGKDKLKPFPDIPPFWLRQYFINAFPPLPGVLLNENHFHNLVTFPG